MGQQFHQSCLKLQRLCWGVEAKPTSKSRQALRSSPSSTSSPAMPPKINGSTMADLVKQAVQKEVTLQLNETHELLKAASARIAILEEEIAKYKVTPRLPSTPSSSSSVCRHWLRNRCTWSGVSLKRSCKMQFRRVDLVSIGPPSQKC